MSKKSQNSEVELLEKDSEGITNSIRTDEDVIDLVNESIENGDISIPSGSKLYLHKIILSNDDGNGELHIISNKSTPCSYTDGFGTDFPNNLCVICYYFDVFGPSFTAGIGSWYENEIEIYFTYIGDKQSSTYYNALVSDTVVEL